jgi:hypothetical protein
VSRRVVAEELELLDDAEAAWRRLDAAHRLVTGLLVVAPRPRLATDGERLDALDDGVVGVDVAVETAHLPVGDDVDPGLLHVADRGARRVVEHLLHVGGTELAALERLHRREPPPGLAVGSDDRGGQQRQ